MTDDEVLAELREAVRLRSIVRWSKAHSFSPSYVSDVLHRRKPPSDRLLAALGLERVVTYRRKKERKDG